jgi:hypothetical protein
VLLAFPVDTIEEEVCCTTLSGDAKMTEETRPTSTIQKNAEVLHTLYGLLDSDREPTDQDAQSLRYLYASS